MNYYIILGRVPNTSGWSLIGKGKAQSPEEAHHTILDDEVINSFPEMKFLPVESDDEGNPKHIRLYDLVN